MKLYQRKGYTDQWISARLEKIRARSVITFEWGSRGASESRHFARLTDTLSMHSLDVTTSEHRQVKGITNRQNLHDSMTPAELAISTLTEIAATTLHQEHDSQGFNQPHSDCVDAGKMGGEARSDLRS